MPTAYVARRLPAGPLTVAAGLVCLLAVAALAAGGRLRRVTGRAGAVVVGLVSGAMNVVAGISGPPVVLFALNAEWPAERVRPTMQLFFLGLNALTLLSLGRPDRLPAGLMVGFVGGLAGGALLAGRPSGTAVRAATLAIAAAGSVLAVARGLTL